MPGATTHTHQGNDLHRDTPNNASSSNDTGWYNDLESPNTAPTTLTHFLNTAALHRDNDLYRESPNNSSSSNDTGWNYSDLLLNTTTTLHQDTDLHGESPTNDSIIISRSDTELSDFSDMLLIPDSHHAMAEDVLYAVRYVVLPLAIVLTHVNVVVFLNRRMRSSTGTYVVALSVAQLLNLYNDVASLVLTKVVPNAFSNYYYWVYAIHVGAYLAAVSRRGSYLVMCLVSAERLAAITRPLHIHQLVLRQHPKVMIGVAYLSAAVVHLRILVGTEIREFRRGGRVGYGPALSPVYLQSPAFWDALQMLAVVLFLFLPLGLLLLLTLLIIRGLRRHNIATSAHMMTSASSSSSASDAKRQQERQMTVTILTVTSCYVVMSYPHAVHFLSGMIFGDVYAFFGKYQNLYRVVNLVSSNLTILSCALDFVCFLLTSSNYRAVFFRVVRVKRRGKGRGGGGEGATTTVSGYSVGVTTNSQMHSAENQM